MGQTWPKNGTTCLGAFCTIICPNYWTIRNYMGVSKNRGTPKWMVYNGKPYWTGWFGGKTHYFWKHPYNWNNKNSGDIPKQPLDIRDLQHSQPQDFEIECCCAARQHPTTQRTISTPGMQSLYHVPQTELKRCECPVDLSVANIWQFRVTKSESKNTPRIT